MILSVSEVLATFTSVLRSRWELIFGHLALSHQVMFMQRSRCKPQPQIHGELLKLGLEVSEATVAKYMVPRRLRRGPCCVRIGGPRLALRADLSGGGEQFAGSPGASRVADLSKRQRSFVPVC
jgi:hypothetical protein